VVTLLLWAALSIGFSFLCSILEAVLLSVTPSFVTQQLQSGSTTGKLLNEYKEDIDKPLAAILTLNTIAHTVGAMGVGAVAGKLYGGQYLMESPFPISWETIIAVVMTLLILFASEIIPKTIGANNWRSLSGFTTRTLKFLLFILAPLVWVSTFITKSFKKDKNKSVLSRSDFAAMTQLGESSGAISDEESEIIGNLLNFEKMTVRDIMTPRSVAYMLEEKMTISDFKKNTPSKTYSRIPVYKDDKDNITGVVLKDDILLCIIEEGNNQEIKDLMLDVIFVIDSMPLPELFKNLTKEKQHLFVVKDEFGTVVGLVTMEDMFETLLGQEIVDESDKVIDLQKYAKEKFGQDQ